MESRWLRRKKHRCPKPGKTGQDIDIKAINRSKVIIAGIFQDTKPNKHDNLTVI